MADVTIQIPGLDRLAAGLRQLPRDLGGRVLGAPVKEAGLLVQNSARARVRRLTGAVMASTVAWHDRSSTDEHMVYDVGVTMRKTWPKKPGNPGLYSRQVTRRAEFIQRRRWPAFWWRYLEFGTRRQPAYPFLVPGFEAVKMAAVELIKTRLAAGLEAAAAKLGGGYW